LNIEHPETSNGLGSVANWIFIIYIDKSNLLKKKTGISPRRKTVSPKKAHYQSGAFKTHVLTGVIAEFSTRGFSVAGAKYN
jgi:hypothetical protein